MRPGGFLKTIDLGLDHFCTAQLPDVHNILKGEKGTAGTYTTSELTAAVFETYDQSRAKSLKTNLRPSKRYAYVFKGMDPACPPPGITQSHPPRDKPHAYCYNDIILDGTNCPIR